MNLHFKLEGLRSSAAAPPTAPTAPPARRRGPGSQPSSSASRHPGPRLAVVGPPSSGRSTALRTLAAYAVRGGRWQPLVVGADPTGEGVLSLPGTLSAAVCAGVADLEAPAATAGWGRSPSSGPSQVPVRTPVVFYYGRRSIGGIGSGGGVSEKGEDGSSTGAGKGSVATYKRLVARLAAAVSGRLADDEAVRASGLLVDVPAMSGSGGDVQYDILAHIVEELSGRSDANLFPQIFTAFCL